MVDVFYTYYQLFFCKESTNLLFPVQASMNLTTLFYLYQPPKHNFSSAMRCSIKFQSVIAAKMASSTHNNIFNITVIFNPSPLSR